MSESQTTSTAGDLEALNALQADASELERIEELLDRFNVFEAIGFVGQEVKHSHFLAFLLDPRQNHGIGELFLKRFLQESSGSARGISIPLNFESIGDRSLEKTMVKTEVPTNHGRKLDILVTNEAQGFAVIIENKVEAPEYSNQLNDYYKFVQDKYPDLQMFGIYLTPFGKNPSNRDYHPLGYGTVCDILEEILQDQEICLHSDVRVAVRHYTNMVRKHILGYPELKGLSRRFYERHRKALNTIYEYRPDSLAQGANLPSDVQKLSRRYPGIGSFYQNYKRPLDFVFWENSKPYSIVHSEIRRVLERLIEEEAALDRDSDEGQKIRFGVQEWDTLALLTAKDWTRSDRILLFELWNYQNTLDLYLFMGPGPKAIRQRLIAMVRANTDVFITPRNLRRGFLKIYSRNFLKQEAYEDLDHEEREEEIRRQWSEFLHQDLPRIEKAVNNETWIWEPI